MTSNTTSSQPPDVASQEQAVATGPTPGGGLRLKTAAGRWVIFATVLGTGIVFLDGTVVNIALPTIGRDFGASLETLQWTATAYLLTLSALILSGGSLGDRLGRRRIFVVGALWFAGASLLCALAPTAGVLIAARALQGVGGALMTPGSLAIIQASFHPDDRAQAIGLWSGLSGVALAIGPFLGGWLIQAASWRLIFLINVPPIAAVVWVARRHVPETRDPNATGRIDVAGSALAALGLGGLIYGLIAGPNAGWTSPAVLAALIGSVVVLAAFIVLELRRPDPMLPLSMFRVRQFSGANLTTFAVYGALGGALFLVPLQLQQVLGYSPLASGVALLPVTIVMLLLSGRAGKLSQRIGPRLPMTVGPIVAGAGLALLSRVGPGATYMGAFLPAIMVFAFGLVLTVAPLTAAVLSAAPSAHAGVASAVNNAVARAAGLIAVAALPAAAGITASSYTDPAAFSAGFSTAVLISGGLAAVGGVIAFVTIPHQVAAHRGGAVEPASAPPPEPACALEAPLLTPDCAGCEA
jgi:EmrB/QacA subfamily drug resistance transporter